MLLVTVSIAIFSSRTSGFSIAFMESAAGDNAEASQTAYKTYCSVLDKAAKGGIIARNTAIRRKSRAANRLRAGAAG